MLIAFAALAFAIAAFWLALTIAPARRWPAAFFLVEPGRQWADSPPSGDHTIEDTVTAIVPARDEAATLPISLPLLLAQRKLEAVIVVDDGSSDGTSDVARRVADESIAAATELRVIAARPRPDGWSGKVHALAQGLEAARNTATDSHRAVEWLLFTDADIAHHPDSVRALLEKSREGAYDLVSVMARLSATTFWERLLVPPFVYFFHLLYPFRLVARADSPVAAAAGGCVLIRASALARAGGLESIAGELIDDVSLAKTLARCGSRVWLGLDPGIVSVRDYDFGELWNMVARNAFVQLRHNWLLLVAVLLGIAVFVCAPPVLVLGGLLSARTGGWAGWSVASLGGIAWILESAALLPYVRHHRVPAIYAWTLPIAAAFYAAMTLSSALAHLTGKEATWRGRVYRRAE